MDQEKRPKVGTSYREILEEYRRMDKKPREERFDSGYCEKERRFRDDDADCCNCD